MVERTLIANVAQPNCKTGYAEFIPLTFKNCTLLNLPIIQAPIQSILLDVKLFL